METILSVVSMPARLAALLCILLLGAAASQAQDASAEDSDQFGDVLACGDFNGDGYQDLAVGLPFEAISNGPPPQINAAGAVEVIYGTVNGLASPSRQFWRQGASSVEDGAESGDVFGSALAAGDFNGDGYEDLAIGVPSEDIGTIQDAGAVNVLYGSSAGLSTSAVADQFWHQNVASVQDVAEDGDNFGWSLATGDFNRDGYEDLAIGAWWEDVGTAQDAGAVNLIYGSPAGLSAISVPDQFWHQNVASVVDVAETGDAFGVSLATTDFNGDAYDDLAIGVWGEDIGSILAAGAVNVLHGSVSGLSASAVPDQLWHQDVPNVEDTAESGDLWGWKVATGDFNGDGHGDLAISVGSEDLGSLQDAGAVNVLYGSGMGLSAIVVPDQFWHQNVGNVDDAAEPGDYWGWSLATGDFDGDGNDDLAIGVPNESVGSVPVAGAANVLYGSRPSGLATRISQFWHQDVADVEGVATDGDAFGLSLTAGDFNRDGRDDLAVGAPREDLFSANGMIWNAGAVNAIYGSLAGLSATGVLADQLWTQSYILPPFP